MSRAARLLKIEEWEEAVCTECGRVFPQKRAYEKKCLLCFKVENEYDVLQGDLAFMWMQERLAAEAEQRTKEKEKEVKRRKQAEVKLRGARQSLLHAAQTLQGVEEALRKSEKALIHEVKRRLRVGVLLETTARDLRAEKRRVRPAQSNGPLSHKQLKDLIFLCHPDRHSNSERATVMTKLLLELRGKR